MKCFLLAMALVLGGCTAGQQAFVQAGIEGSQQAKDEEAKVLGAAICATSLGAYHRIYDDQERAALDILCGGDRTDALRDLAIDPPE